MSLMYESTRSKKIKRTPSESLLNGLSPDGGLFVLRDLDKMKIDINSLIGKDYYGIASEVLKKFLDFNDEDINNCVCNAYKGKFITDEPANLVTLKNAHILELFNGPTSAFKDFGLLMLPQLITKALTESGLKRDILILTATSGDTGKAALEGFKNVDKTKIIVFYPYGKVSKIQELQMLTQEGNNVGVGAIEGNFDDAQNGVKSLFGDENFLKTLDHKNLQLSSANSINIGRLAAQTVYYFYSYIKLVENNKIKMGDKINFVVPTGNFGNILSGYYGLKMGLPVNKFICASNSNNVLYDFLNTGIYNRKREFLKTISPSMDILISSNLERLLYYASKCDNEYVAQLMDELKEKGQYRVDGEVFKSIKEYFVGGFADDAGTKDTIKKVFENENYLLDPHTGVAYKIFSDYMEKHRDVLGNFETVILSTASPYKFSRDVMSVFKDVSNTDDFTIMEQLHEMTKVPIPHDLKNLANKKILHNNVIKTSQMKDLVLDILRRIDK
jgi:threonine synthase